jgi:hypothetical protein
MQLLGTGSVLVNLPLELFYEGGE